MSMSRFRRIELLESPSPIFFAEATSVFKPFPSFTEMELGFAALDLLTPTPSPFDFDAIAELVQIETTPLSYKRLQLLERKKESQKLTSLCDRVAALESGFEKMAKKKKEKKERKELDRKYSWTAEIKSGEKDGVDKKYKWKTEIRGGGKKEEKSYEYVAEFKGKGKDASVDRRYIFKASSNPAQKVVISHKEEDLGKKNKCEKAKAKPKPKPRVVEIEEEDDEEMDQGVIVLKQAFAKRGGSGANGKGKKKEMSPQDAAVLIQMRFKAYLVRRSKLLRALRDLAVAKSKLKEIRTSFNNFSYRRLIDRDAAERQKFTERVIVLLLTVDAIEGVDLMVRAARRSIIDELEAMLDVVDPQPNSKLGSMKRRTFDMPDGTIQKEIAAGVAEVVQMLERDEKNGHDFEVCL